MHVCFDGEFGVVVYILGNRTDITPIYVESDEDLCMKMSGGGGGGLDRGKVISAGEYR